MLRKKKGFTLIELPVVRKSGFTLIELLIVIAIIGILAAIVMVALSTARKRAYDVRIKSDLTEISKALEIAKTDGMLEDTASWVELNSPEVAKIKDVDSKALVPTPPTNPISGRKYYIYTNKTNDVAKLYAQLSDASKGWCVKDGNSFAAPSAPTKPSTASFCD